LYQNYGAAKKEKFTGVYSVLSSIRRLPVVLQEGSLIVQFSLIDNLCRARLLKLPVRTIIRGFPHDHHIMQMAFAYTGVQCFGDVSGKADSAVDKHRDTKRVLYHMKKSFMFASNNTIIMT
jgi:hypothetical protein